MDYSNYIFSPQPLWQEKFQLRNIKSVEENRVMGIKAMNEVIKALINIFMVTTYKNIPTYLDTWARKWHACKRSLRLGKTDHRYHHWHTYYDKCYWITLLCVNLDLQQTFIHISTEKFLRLYLVTFPFIISMSSLHCTQKWPISKKSVVCCMVKYIHCREKIRMPRWSEPQHKFNGEHTL